jgi:hypothetical protein
VQGFADQSVGVRHRARTVERHRRRPPLAQPFLEHLGRGQSAQTNDDVGSHQRRELLVAQQWIEVRKRSARGGVAEDHPIESDAVGHRLGVDAVTHNREHAPAVKGHLDGTNIVLSDDTPRRGAGSTGRQFEGVGEQWFDERGVQVHGAGVRRRTSRVEPQAARERAPGGRRVEARNARLFKPSHHRCVEVALVDGLGRADAVQLLGAVRRHHDQRDAGEIGFGDGRVQFRRSRPTRHHHHDRTTRRERSTDREESGTALVKAHVQLQFAALGGGHDQRCRARTGADHDVTQSVSTPLVEQRRGKRCLHLARARYALLQCHSSGSSAKVPARPSYGCTVSPKRALPRTNSAPF